MKTFARNIHVNFSHERVGITPNGGNTQSPSVSCMDVGLNPKMPLSSMQTLTARGRYKGQGCNRDEQYKKRALETQRNLN